MCIVCADMSGQLRRTNFVSEDISLDLAVSSGQRTAGGDPLAFLDLPDRGGTASNGKISLTPADAGAYITRAGASWSSLGQPATITYAFRSNAPATMPSDTTGFSRFNAQQIQATELMLLAWSDVARITFNRVGTGTEGDGAYSDAAVMLFGNYSAGQSGAAAFAYFPGNTNHGANSGDVWVNSSIGYNSSPQYLSYGYQVLLHEIGHGIGLGHPGDYNAGSGGPITYANSAEYYEDSRMYTVMSYFSETNTGGAFGGRYAASPLLDDIAAAQRLYGANMTTRTGDTVYGFNSTADRLWYSAGTQLGQQAVIFAVWDAGGTDTLDFQHYANGGTIDLRQGHFSSVGGLTGNVAIAMGAVIENAIGGSGAEIMIGNAAANVLRGNGGNDQIEGGAGSDTAVFSGNRSQYTVTAGTEVVEGVTYGLITVTGPDGTDTLRNVEFLQFADQTIAAPALTAGIRLEGDATANTLNGTAFADWLFGGDATDTLNGGDGDDRLAGGRGSDTLNGGAGTDEADFSGAFGAVSVNLGAGTAVGVGPDGTDTLNSIENVRGSIYNDTIFGNGVANVIRGGGGVDMINGEGGNDTLIAGQGSVVGAPDVIKPSSTSNTSIGTAINIDGNFDLVNDAGVLNATTVPHAVIKGTTTGFGLEYYAFTVTAGAACTFDIANASFDTVIRIVDAGGSSIAVNDDDGSSTNSLLNHTFATGGTYYIVVGQYSSGSGGSVVAGSPPFGSTYTLNVSVPGHSVIEAQEVGSTLNGGDGDDTLVSGSSNDSLRGNDGTDTAVYTGNRSQYVITNNGGSFTISGPDGTDTLIGVEFAQFADITVSLVQQDITGTESDDLIFGTSGADTIYALAGNDEVYAQAGNDLVYAGDGNDVVGGGAGDDTLLGGLGSDGLYGEDGDDVLVGEAGNDILAGGAGNDAMEAGDGADQLYGEDGDDFMDAGSGADLLSGGAGHDAMYGGAGADQLYGDAGRDLLAGGADNDIAGGGADNDFIYGEDGDDQLYGEDGDDIVSGGAGADLLSGGAGNDNVIGDDGADVLFGELGNDTLQGGADNDVLEGGDGDDRLYGEEGSDTLIAGAGNDLLGGGDGADYLYGQEGEDQLYGEGGADLLAGGAGSDLLAGGEGNDTLYGEDGADRLFGEGGDDFLVGGAGDDVIYGGEGVDTAGYAGLRSAYTVTIGAGFVTVSGAEGADTLFGVERVRFGDGEEIVLPVAAAELAEPQVLPIETFIGSDDAIVCPLIENWAKIDAPRGPSVSALNDPLILIPDFDMKSESSTPVVCDGGEVVSQYPWAVVSAVSDDSGRDPHWLLMQPRSMDWVW